MRPFCKFPEDQTIHSIVQSRQGVVEHVLWTASTIFVLVQHEIRGPTYLCRHLFLHTLIIIIFFQIESLHLCLWEQVVDIPEKHSQKSRVFATFGSSETFETIIIIITTSWKWVLSQWYKNLASSGWLEVSSWLHPFKRIFGIGKEEEGKWKETRLKKKVGSESGEVATPIYPEITTTKRIRAGLVVRLLYLPPPPSIRGQTKSRNGGVRALLTYVDLSQRRELASSLLFLHPSPSSASQNLTPHFLNLLLLLLLLRDRGRILISIFRICVCAFLIQELSARMLIKERKKERKPQISDIDSSTSSSSEVHVILQSYI